MSNGAVLTLETGALFLLGTMGSDIEVIRTKVKACWKAALVSGGRKATPNVGVSCEVHWPDVEIRGDEKRLLVLALQADGHCVAIRALHLPSHITLVVLPPRQKKIGHALLP